MAKHLRVKANSESDIGQKKKRAPASNLDSRENQLISLAYKEAEMQIAEGRASSQVLTHFLQLGSTVNRLAKEKLENENNLLKAKVEALNSQKRVEELYAEALNAMKAYSGQEIETNEN